MERSTENALPAALIRMLRPLVRILLRSGTSCRTFADIAKWLFVDVAKQEYGLQGRNPSISRISVITGLSRKEVKRVLDLPPPQERLNAEKYNRAARVIFGWQRDPDFLNESGTPADLPLKGVKYSFRRLVKRYSGDLPHRTVLDELLRIGAVSLGDQGAVKLNASRCLPKGRDIEKLKVLATSVGHLIGAIDQNLPVERMPLGYPFLQRNVAGHNLPEQAIAENKRRVNAAARNFLEQLDLCIAGLDPDADQTITAARRKEAGVSVYYFEKPLEGKTPDHMRSKP